MKAGRDYMRSQAAKPADALAALMERTAEDWERCLSAMTAAQALTHPTVLEGGLESPAAGEGPKWCPKEVIGHYLVSERGLNKQAAEMAGVPPPAEAEPVRKMGVELDDCESLPLDELRGRLAGFFAETRTLVDALDAAPHPDKTFPHPLFGQLSAKEWMVFHRLHGMDHIQQIERIKSDPAYPAA